MKVLSFIYRQKQKIKYHFATNSFERKVAEINKHAELIKLQASTFEIVDCKLIFSIEHHSFVVNRFDLFLSLLRGEGTFKIQNDILLFNINTVTLRIITAEELFIVNEIFISGSYRVYTGEKFNVIDIGMNVGFASLFFASNSNIKKVISFEPFQSTYQDAQANFLLNEEVSRKIVSYNYGLGHTNRNTHVSYSSDLKGKNGIMREAPKGVKIELRAAVEVFDNILKENSDDLFFIKMDCEGAEFEIFESLKFNLIPRAIFGFIIEWHENNPQPIIDVLLQNGFRVQQTGSLKIGLIVAFR